MFKLIIFCASMAVISCAHIDSREQVEVQVQKAEELVQRQNDEIREHKEHEQEQRQLHQQNLEDRQREQTQRIRDNNQEQRDRINENRYDNFNRNQQTIPAFITFQPAIVHIPARNLNNYDDSNYNFQYTVNDRSTGDFKSHQETRRGDQVQGEYRLMDSDGYQRIVNYRANDRDGFDAEVRREPTLTTLVQHHQQQQNYADQHNQNRQLYTLYQTQHPSFYTSQSFNRNDEARRNQHSTTATSTNF